VADIYQFDDYKTYLTDISNERGIRAAWADAIGCQRGYLTSVLNGAAHLSLEQTEKLSAHLSHNDDEKTYLLLLVQKARAGTQGLKDHFQRQLRGLRDARSQIRSRYEKNKNLSAEQQAEFYSSWYYVAIHLCLQLGIDQRDKIATKLSLDVTQVNAVLEFFLKSGFAEIDAAGKWKPLHPTTFLPGDSPFIVQHHTNWRLQAIRSVEATTPDDVHYSAVVTLTKEEIPELRKMLLKTVDEFRKGFGNIPNETEMYAFTLDLFPVLKR